jgi:hypothetical protein
MPEQILIIKELDVIYRYLSFRADGGLFLPVYDMHELVHVNNYI